MAINLSTVSISLDRFDAVSDGTFNIGHIKLSEDGKDIVRTNRHKTFEFLNKNTIPPEETLAIKVRAIIGGAKVISTDSTGKQVPNTRRHREQVIKEITGILSKNRYDPETVVKNAKLEGIDDDEIEGNLNIDAIEGGA